MNEPVKSSHEISPSAPVSVPPVEQAVEQASAQQASAQQAPVEESQAAAATMSLPMSDAPVAAVTAEAMTAVVDGAPLVGRYTHAQLAAMQGKRGRKPLEFYQLFPKTDAPTVVAKPKPAKAAGETLRRPRVPVVRISSAMIGDHSIDELLEMVGVTGKKPVAYDILRQAAQVFADRDALDLPQATHDRLAQQVATAPARIRELISELLRLGKR